MTDNATPTSPPTPEETLQQIENSIRMAREQAAGTQGHCDRTLVLIARYRDALRATRPSN
jgi:hypothetical protein